ncbi:hypothetical protein ASG01_00825 [Chryseobacterium sp. Leaf180]|nr:hypothetical protein ASG01_00825 [Chryseobacterium sp. Leaf180]
MKKLLSFLLIALYLLSTTELYQLAKMPLLVQHYIEHKQLSPEMPLMAFINAHYAHPANDKDAGTDQKLPFVMHAKTLSLVFIVQNKCSLTFQRVIVYHHAQKIPFSDEDVSLKGFTDSAWEPPRGFSV